MYLNFYQIYKMAIKSILSNKGRSFLTMLGVIIGVASVISAVAYAQGSTKNVTDSIQKLGTNMVQIQIRGRASNRTVSYDDLKAFSEENSDKITAIAPSTSSSVTVKYNNNNASTTLIGTSTEYEEIKDVHVQSGRFLLSYDLDYYQKVALIGTYVANELFEGTNPINQKIKINGQQFTVVGVLTERASSEASTDDDQIIIPVTVAQRLTRSGQIKNFMVQVASSDQIDTVIELLNAFLLKIYSSTNSFSVFNQAQMLDTLNSVTSSMMLILGGIAAISLVVGGIGIMNIMLVSVTERTREIGIRKAIGAKKKNILVQFLIESLMITGIGGIIGLLLGVVIIKFIVAGLSGLPAVYSLPWMTISFGISLMVGVIFGMFPAYKAANLNPIEALRYE